MGPTVIRERDAGGPVPRRPVVLAGVAALLVYLFACVVLSPDVLHLASHAPEHGDGDPGLFIFFLANTSRSIWHAHGAGLLVTHRLNAPYGVNVMWNTGLLLPGAVLSPLTELAGPVATFNVLLLTAPGLSAWSAYLCAGRVLDSRWARFVTGLAFGFSPAVVAESQGHLQLTLLWLVPPLLLLSLDLVTGRRASWRSGVLLGLTAGAQLLVGEEVLVLTAFAVGVVLFLLAAQRPYDVLVGARRLAVGSATALPALLVVAGYPLLVQLTGPQRVHGELQRHDLYKLDPAQLVVPSPDLVLRTSGSLVLQVKDQVNSSELLGYVGVPMLLLVVTALVVLRRSLVVRTCGLSAAALAVLALGPTLRFDGHATGLSMPWRLADRVSLLLNVLPVRWMLLVDLLLALVLGACVQALAGHGRRVLAVLLAVVVLVPFVPRPSTHTDVAVPRYFADGAPGLTGNVLLVPLPDAPIALPMTWQAEAGLGFNVVSGYFVGPDSRGRAKFGSGHPLVFRRWLAAIRTTGTAPALLPIDIRRIRAGLQAIDVHTIALGPSPHTEAYTALITEVVGAPPVEDRGVLLWRGV